MIFSPIFQNRDFTARAQLPTSYRINVDSMVWAAMGGCSNAQFSVKLGSTTAKPDPLFELFNMLRCPVIIENEAAYPVWWGFINEVTISAYGRSWTVSLDGMYNAVRVMYSPQVSYVGTALSVQLTGSHLHDTSLRLGYFKLGDQVDITGSVTSGNNATYHVTTEGNGDTSAPLIVSPAITANDSANAALGFTSGRGQFKKTGTSIDVDSSAEFGVKGIQLSAQGMSDAAAIAYRDIALTTTKKARGYPGGQAISDTSAVVTCKGWWSTLEWHYAFRDAMADTDTVEQIGAQIVAAAQFFTASDLDAYSGITTPPFQGGDTDIRTFVENLCNIGTTNGLRMLGNVDVNRRVHIYEEPANTTIAYLQRRDGKLIYPQGALAIPDNNIAGTWCRDTGAIPLLVDLYHLTDPGLYFIESVQWDSMNGLTPTPRGLPQVSDILMTDDTGKLLNILQPYI